MEPKILKCYIERNRDGWEGICVDLDIGVQGDSFDDVISQLEDAVSVYVETVMELPEADRARLLNRRTPFFRRLRYFALRRLVRPASRPQLRRDIPIHSGRCAA